MRKSRNRTELPADNDRAKDEASASATAAVSNRSVAAAFAEPRRDGEGHPGTSRWLLSAARFDPHQSLPPSHWRSALDQGVRPSAVRLFVNEQSAELTGRYGVDALTVGSDIVVHPDAYQPATPEGKALLDHEIAHVGQGGTKLRAGQTETAGETQTEPGVTDGYLDQLQKAIEHYRQASEFDAAQDKLAVPEPELGAAFWLEVLDDPLKRAFNFRTHALLVELPYATDDDIVRNVLQAPNIAKDEQRTLGLLGEQMMLARRSTAWAFPSTWAARAEGMLQPPSDLDPERVAASQAEASGQLQSIEDGAAARLLAEGLPVDLGSALQLGRGTPIDRLVDLSGGSVYAELWRAAAEAQVAASRLRIASGWQGRKAALVADVRAGTKTIDPHKWALVSSPRVFQPDTMTLANLAISGDLSLAQALNDNIDLERYEIALAVGAALGSALDRVSLSQRVRYVVGRSVSATDLLIAGMGEDVRLDLAFRWGDLRDYDRTALLVVGKALADNADEIAMDTGKDMLISAIPVIGWFWGAKELIETGVELYQAGEKLYGARQRVRNAQSVVGVQRGSAEIAMAEVGLAASVALAAISEGVNFGARKISAEMRSGGDGSGSSPAPGGTVPDSGPATGSGVDTAPDLDTGSGTGGADIDSDPARNSEGLTQAEIVERQKLINESLADLERDPGLIDVDPAVARQIDDPIYQARIEEASHLFAALPDIENRKNVASGPTGEPITSGWGGDKAGPTERVNVEGREAGHETTPHVFDRDFEGQYESSHSERLAAAGTSHTSFASSKFQCPACQRWFAARAMAQGQAQFVGEPSGVRVFHPDGRVEIVPHPSGADTVRAGR